jgi:hypothetical protein
MDRRSCEPHGGAMLDRPVWAPECCFEVAQLESLHCSAESMTKTSKIVPDRLLHEAYQVVKWQGKDYGGRITVSSMVSHWVDQISCSGTEAVSSATRVGSVVALSWWTSMSTSILALVEAEAPVMRSRPLPSQLPSSHPWSMRSHSWTSAVKLAELISSLCLLR